MELWLTLLLVQVVLPLALLATLMVVPWRSVTAWLLVLLATGAVLAVLGIAGLWTVPPWWAWWVYVMLWVLSLALGLARIRHCPVWPSGRHGWVAAAAAALALAAASDFALRAHAGRHPPLSEMPDLGFPLRGGTFLVVNGGSDIRVNAHLKVLDEPRFRAWLGNAHGVDLVVLDPWGRRSSGLLLPGELQAYVSQGWPVLAPCSGEVIRAVDGVAELRPPQIDPKVAPSGNHVVLHCDGMHVLLAHFERGSVRVVPGQPVVTGQALGAIGNSGRSDEPHLHIHVQRPGTGDAPLGGEPLAVTYDGHYLVRGQRIVMPGPATQETR